MRYVIIMLWMLFWSVPSAIAQVSIGIGLPGMSIGINLPLFPQLVQVPDYPVYYAPRMNANYFFYDGMYWVYQGDNWYASSWYNGPWGLVGPEYVPLYVLRIPVRYYRNPPGYFAGWRPDAPPRWGEHWGNDWAQRRSGWDNWNRGSSQAPAPLPSYQRQYSGDRYPRAEQQRVLREQNYRYQPRDAIVRQHYQEQTERRSPAASERGQQAAPQERAVPQERSNREQSVPRTSVPAQQPSSPDVDRSRQTQRGGDVEQRSAPPQAPVQQRSTPVQEQRQPQQQGAGQREQPSPRPGQDGASQGRGEPQERGRGQGQGQDRERDKGDERGPERNR